MKNPCRKHDGKHEWHDCPDNFQNKKKSKKKKKDQEEQNCIDKESNYSESSSGKDYKLSDDEVEEEKKSKTKELLSSKILMGLPGAKTVFIRLVDSGASRTLFSQQLANQCTGK
eukprot:5685277-Ditylum_brightwellii.AAC.1